MQCYGGHLDGYEPPISVLVTEGQMFEFPLTQRRHEYDPSFAWPIFVPTDYPNLGTARYQVQGNKLMFRGKANGGVSK